MQTLHREAAVAGSNPEPAGRGDGANHKPTPSSPQHHRGIINIQNPRVRSKESIPLPTPSPTTRPQVTAGSEQRRNPS